MVQGELRIVVATIATFVALFGVAIALHGLLFDENDFVDYGTIATVFGILLCALSLNLYPHDLQSGDVEHRKP